MSRLKDLLFSKPSDWGKGLWDAFIPPELSADPELLRRSRLQIGFDWMGFVFGTAYALFYMSIGHWPGARIIFICSLGFALIPLVLRRTKDLDFTGHLFALILLSGFTALCTVEGGLHGHAIAWLASIPLCVLLLLELKGALLWSVACVLTAVGFGALELIGISCVRTYDPKWENLISAAGYFGLVCFMTLLGLIFERTRGRAYVQMQAALGNLSSANERLTRLHEEKDEFLNIAAHDLKNPLCGISGYAELLAFYKTPTPQQITEASNAIQQQSKRMLDIISNLLDIQKIEDGSIQLNIVCCPVEPMLAAMLESYHLRAQAKNIRLVREGDAALPSVSADSAAMGQILDNLLSNAIKYSPRETTVRCVVGATANFVTIDIVDEGPGLSAKDQANLFKKFAKLTPRPTAGESSNGLGLWIVNRMAQAMHGGVTCRSVVGKGSTFSLVLPVWQAGGKTAAAEARNALAAFG